MTELKKGSRVTGGDRDALSSQAQEQVRGRHEHPGAGGGGRPVLRVRAPHPQRVGGLAARTRRRHPQEERLSNRLQLAGQTGSGHPQPDQPRQAQRAGPRAVGCPRAGRVVTCPATSGSSWCAARGSPSAPASTSARSPCSASSGRRRPRGADRGVPARLHLADAARPDQHRGGAGARDRRRLPAGAGLRPPDRARRGRCSRCPSRRWASSPTSPARHPLVAAVGLPKALEWCLTGRKVDAAEAHQAGAAERVVPADELDEAAKALGCRRTR